MESVPLIELRVKYMEHSMVGALMEHEARISEEIREGVRKVLSQENLRALIEDHVHKALIDLIETTMKKCVDEVSEELYQEIKPLIKNKVKEAIELNGSLWNQIWM